MSAVNDPKDVFAAHAASRGNERHALKLLGDWRDWLKLARDSERHPAVREIFAEEFDEAVERYQRLHAAMAGPLLAEEKEIRERFKHELPH